MKIWLWNHYATSMFRDHAGRHYWFAQQLAARGYDTAVFCASTFLNSDEMIDTQGRACVVQESDGVPFVFVKTPPYRGNGMARVKNMLAFYRNLYPAAREYTRQTGKPDVILASSVHPLTMLAGIRIARKLGVPCICEIRDLWPEAIFAFGRAKENSLLGKLLTRGEHWIYRRADALIFTKEGDVDYLKEHGWTTAQGGDIDLAKCHYINNGIDLAAYDRHIGEDVLDDADLQDDGLFTVVYAGSIRPVNNVGNLLDCAKLLAAYPDIRFLIYGDGIELPALQQRAEAEGLDNVRLKGRVDRKYIPYILSKSAVNMLNYSPSNYNWTRGNSSNKLFEYMASGKPVICTMKMGYSIIERYRCGLELDECTPQALAEAIFRLRALPPDEYAALGRNARAGAADFDFGVLTDKLVGVIESVRPC